MSNYKGDFPEDAAVPFFFNTVDTSGEPVTIGGTAAVEVYKDGGLTQSSAGVTITEDFDGVVGLHRGVVDMSADAFYSAASNYAAVVSTGTADAVSIVGGCVAEWSCENRFASANGYQIKVSVQQASATDRWTVTVYRNGVAITGAVTSPTLTVTNNSGVALFTTAAMTRIGSTATYVVANANMIDVTKSYAVEFVGTIDGSSRTIESNVPGAIIADVAAITNVASSARKLAALTSAAIDGTAGVGGSSTSATIALADSQSVGTDDLAGCVIVTVDGSQPPRRIASNTSGTSPVCTTETSTTIPDGTDVVITGYIPA